MSFKDQMLRGLKWTTVGTVGLAIFQLLQISILTRFLPKEDFGLIALATLIVNFTNIFVEMGLTSAIFHKQDASKEEYNSLYWLNLMLSITLYIMLFNLAKPIANFYNEEELINVIKILGINIILISIGKQHKAILQKKLMFDLVAKIDLFSYFIGLTLAVFLAWNNWGVYSLVYSTLITSFLSSSILLYIRLSRDPINFRFSLQDTKPFLKVGGFSFASNILDYFSRQLDIIIIGKLVGIQFLGVYSLAKQISLKAYSVMMPIVFNVFNPLLATLNEEKKKMESMFLKMLYGLSNLTFPIYLLIILAASEIITLMYGNEYKEGSLTLVGLLIFQTCFTIVKPSGSLQIATGRTDIGFLWTIFRNVLTILILFFAASFFDPIYISLFLGGLSIVLVFLIWPFQIRQMSSIKYNTYLRQFIFPLFAFLAIVALKFIFLDNILTQSNKVISGVLKIFIGLFLYFIILILFDRRKLKKTFNMQIFNNGQY